MIMESPQADVQSQKAAKVGELASRLQQCESAERHRNLAETCYWLDQYKQLARAAIATLQTSGSVGAPKWSPTPPTKDGWVLVPRVPSNEMLDAAGTMNNYDIDAGGRRDDDHIAWWEAMLAAVPHPAS